MVDRTARCLNAPERGTSSVTIRSARTGPVPPARLGRGEMRPLPSPDGPAQQVPPFATSYVAEATSIPRARRALRSVAEAGGATAAQLDDIALASSEAITN